MVWPTLYIISVFMLAFLILCVPVLVLEVLAAVMDNRGLPYAD